MDTASYWKKRELQLKKRQIKNTGNYEYALESRLKDLQREINKEVKYWMTKYADNNEISQQEAERILNGIDTKHFELTLEEFERKAKQGGNDKLLNSEYYKSRVARAEQIKKQLEHLGGQFAGTESDQLRRALEAQYADTYYHETWLNQQAYGDLSIDFNHFDEDQLRAVAGKPWQGSDFSERVWGEYRRELPSQLSDAILRGILLGESYAKVSKRMEDRMADVKKSSVHRLVSTEMGHIAEQATYDFYKDEGLKEYEYLATLETRTCSICGGLDGKHFKVSEAKPGVNYPLIHPYCRCTTIPYRPDLPPLETRWERDPKTGKGRIVDYQTYDQWAQATNAFDYMAKKKEFSFTINGETIRSHTKRVSGTDLRIWSEGNGKKYRDTLQKIRPALKKYPKEMVPDVVLTDSKLEKVGGKVFGAYDHGSDALYINCDELSDSKAIDEMAKSDYFASKSVDDIITHEMAHKRNWEKAKEIFKKSKEKYSTVDDALRDMNESIASAAKNIAYTEPNILSRYLKQSLENNRYNEVVAELEVLNQREPILADKLKEVLK